jgi:cholesterol oxidase
MNYQPMARRAGAEIYTQTKVDWVEKLDSGGWRIHGSHYHDMNRRETFKLEARHVILAAGSINTTEILLRSEMHGLRVSPRLGSGFSGNGDFFGVCYNGNLPLQVLGFGNHPDSPGARTPPGPTITGTVKYDGGRPVNRRFLVEDVSFPTSLFRASQISFAALRGQDTDIGDEAQERNRVLRDLSQSDVYSPDGALNRTLLYLVTAFDDAKGYMRFDAPFWEPDGRMTVEWEGAGGQAMFSTINEELRRHARAVGATFVENPSGPCSGCAA